MIIWTAVYNEMQKLIHKKKEKKKFEVNDWRTNVG